MTELTERQLSTWEGIAITAAMAAAALIRESLGDVTSLGVKSSPTDVVTQTDVDSEALLRHLLLEATPDAGIIGEEGGQTSAPAALQWIIDPLDGTINFTYGLPVFAVSVAAAYDGTIVVGAVVDVLRDEVFSAVQGRGARCNGSPIATSACSDLALALVTTGFSYRAELRQAQGRTVSTLLPRVRDIRCFGSAALQLCWLAAGRIDGYYERDTKIWDYAAASIVASEAGAVVELHCPENDSLVFATNRHLFDELRRLIDTVPESEASGDR